MLYLKTNLYSNLAKDLLNAALNFYTSTHDGFKKSATQWMFAVLNFDAYESQSLDGEIFAHTLDATIFLPGKEITYHRQLAKILFDMLLHAPKWQLNSNNTFNQIEIDPTILNDPYNQTIIAMKKPYVLKHDNPLTNEDMFVTAKVQDIWILYYFLLNQKSSIKQLQTYPSQAVVNVLGHPRDPMQIEMLNLLKQESSKIWNEYLKKKNEIEHKKYIKTIEIKTKYDKILFKLKKEYVAKITKLEAKFK